MIHEYEILDLVNAVRADNGAEPLVMVSEMNIAARERIEKICVTGNMVHDGWKDTLDKHYDSALASENLARGYHDAGSTVQALADSPSHFAAMTNNRFSETGIATIRCHDSNHVVQLFASPADNTAPLILVAVSAAALIFTIAMTAIKKARRLTHDA